MSADDRRDPTDRPPPVAKGPEPLRRRTPTIPYGVDVPAPSPSDPGAKKGLRGLKAKTLPPPIALSAPKRELAAPSERYERLRPSVEMTAVRDELDMPYELDEALGAHLAWLTDDDAREELMRHLRKGDHARALTMMTEARRRYPRNVSIGRCIQIVERAAITRLLGRIGPLELVPEPVGKPTLGRDPATLFAQIDGKATFEDVLRASPFPRLRSLEILAELVRRNAVRVRDDQLPPEVAHLPAAGGRTPAPRRASTMRPAIAAPVPFSDEDVAARVTIPDPMEVAARAAMLRDQVALERTPKLPPVERRPTPRAEPSMADRRAAGLKAPVEEIAAPSRNFDERAEPEAVKPRPTSLETPQPKVVRKATVRAAAVGAELLAEAERREGAETRRVPSPVAVERTRSEPDDADLSEGARALREVQRERERQEAMLRERSSERPPPVTPQSPGPRDALASPTPRPAPAVLAVEVGEARASSDPVTEAPPSPVPRLEVAANPETLRTPKGDLGVRRLPGGVLGLAAVAVLLSFVAVIIALTRREPPPAPIVMAPTAASPTPAPTPTPEPAKGPATAPPNALGDTMHLVVDASPREARVLLDDVLLTGHPVDQILPRDGKKHALRVEAIGYKTSKTTIEANADTKLIIALELIPTKPLVDPAPKPNDDPYK